MYTGMVAIQSSTQRALLVVPIVFAVICTLAVTLRVVARRRMGLILQQDDYFMVVALLPTLGLIACDLIGVLWCGVGLHIKEVIVMYGMNRLTVFLKVLIPIQLLWATSLTMTKLSILAFYTRIFPTKAIKMIARIITAVIILWGLTVILSAFLLCRPFAFNWDPTIPDGRCGNRVLSYVMTGVLNIVTDVLVLCLPIPVIWKMRMRRASKIALTCMFAVGFFICVVSMIRLKTLLSIDYTDATFSVSTAFIWSMIEPCTAIILACLPVIKTLFGSTFRTIDRDSPVLDSTSPSTGPKHYRDESGVSQSTTSTSSKKDKEIAESRSASVMSGERSRSGSGGTDLEMGMSLATIEEAREHRLSRNRLENAVGGVTIVREYGSAR